MHKLQTQILADFIQANHNHLFPIDSIKGRSKGYYNDYIGEYCQLVAECLSHERNHKHIANSYDLGGDSEITKRLKSSRSFHNLNNKCQAFESTGKYSTGNYNMAYLLQGHFLDRLNELLVVNETIDISKFEQWPKFCLENYDDKTYIEPNIQALTDAIQNYDLTPKERLFVWSLRETYKLNGQQIPQYYKRGGKSNRLFTRGALGCQNLPRRVRELVLSDYNEYDLSAAAYTILLNLSSDKAKYPTIEAYTGDTATFRASIAKTTDATTKDVKLAFLHKSFGSSLTFMSGIAELMPETVLNQIRDNPRFETFCKEYNLLCCELYELQPDKLEEFKQSREVFPPEHPKAGQFRGTYKSSYIAWLYQDKEIEIIQAIRSQLANKDHCLMLHDAIFTKESLCIDSLEKLVYEQTKIKIKIG